MQTRKNPTGNVYWMNVNTLYRNMHSHKITFQILGCETGKVCA